MTNTIPSSVVMVRPSHFGFNAETAVNNAFQNNINDLTPEQIQAKAVEEFDQMVSQLRLEGIEVLVFQDEDDDTPDSIFPNNWFSTFTQETILYPMYTPNRRKERKADIFEQISKQTSKPINTSLLLEEDSGGILEGTGSLVCDYDNKIAYAALSPRTTPEALKKFADISSYKVVDFNALGPDGNLIYHTNVMMTMGDNFVILGTDTIQQDHKERVLASFADSDKKVIHFTNDQIYNHFAGNMLLLSNKDGDKFLVMSSLAEKTLTDEQRDAIASFGCEILAPNIETIETIGGGSVRCMMAELFYS